ncbi:MAG TPA: glycosyltransferase [Candidatus Hydrogenedentes bacterium]|nr:glycosyltransferase [Candidatus Hydrogenedentota bacterium]HPG69958.1 glycosyltransferase [Candidatus Hydrogenedentota bacterium]
MKRFRVAHVITRLCRGGAQENTFHTVRLASRERFDADLISGPTHGPEGSIEDDVTNAGIPIVREPFLVRNIAPIRDAIALRRLTRLFQSRQYDIVHTHTSKAGFLGRLAAERAGVPAVVHTPHGNIFHGYFPKPVTRAFVWMERHAARRTDRIIELTSGGVREHLDEDIGQPDQFRVIFSGIDFGPFDEAIRRRNETRRALGIAPHEVLVGAVGRLEPVKGFAYFVAAAEAIAQAAAEARFILAGAGSLDDELRRRARPLGERFRFLGLRHDVPDLMAAMDILAMPSINEGMGRVLIEAGAASTPAVAASVGGIPDVLDDGATGILVPPGDAGRLAAAVLELIRDADRRRGMGDMARRRVVPAFGLDRMVERIEAVYEELIEEKHLDP